MIISRAWAMPSRWTFQIPPIKKLLDRYVGDGKGWIDPFAGESSLAEITNDLNPTTKTNYHLKAFDFLTKMQGKQFIGVLFDPPYSLRQVKECYQSIGIPQLTPHETNYFPSDERRLAGQLIKPGGISICCGWSSQGIGKLYGFKIIEILLVCHGRSHNDTIVTVERKVNYSLESFATDRESYI